ncbi:bifunctional phosphopantothenoylcysteine decarboxylase/phosphopantothenate--cysteine ligase CoaBC [Acetobacter lambici]|uniref:Coenzyme A biosynthesis bifunctional protein CoaBC n=1 Tax=Acetobacter lambici TaxID=1332824 RepID=A0ABT1EVK8_9PROT|nr:bifunctional phosphopantothenoylcysteine decarboxylase/phosphopantothenate--cysteine ligase CoaBC [Acetobacter lambici]MCP1241340.1 bifunctional phosphopantothenoylcysteine decarboxylase/phosphopantothenate--cysteine ligase CoaBC [Acetobacter lambici]MCP1256990.1 bifunctional phosphopantothenoylcysteine decarboxylase/phosphopantothenate--cysteine ligase CoaBC [Acetobacter lambici]NHO55483.1 bifunctional phosphopantothenoylcysteine decarboxylase/phosphopantothenate--cysteine ligase CoaBC [Acet
MSAASPSRSVLLIVGGSIAAFKAPELVRLLQAEGMQVRCVLTEGGQQFVTPLTLQALSGQPVHTDLFSLTAEQEMGHIALSRSADVLLVCPASANLLARMAGGMADDLAGALLLATDAPVMAVPAMNVRMWEHPATQANVALLAERGVRILPPACGPMACGEFGPGRMPEPVEIKNAVLAFFRQQQSKVGPLAGRRALVTAGPTHEPLDPVRYLANRSSGQQGFALAAALADLGADVTLVSGPVSLPPPAGVTYLACETAREMHALAMGSGHFDVAVCTAAVADWRPEHEAGQKIKKTGAPDAAPPIKLVPNPDILAELAAPGPGRPKLVVGFAAETENVIAHATAKRQRKQCDWIVANDVSPQTGIMGGQENQVVLITADSVEAWPRMSKADVANQLAERITVWLSE